MKKQIVNLIGSLALITGIIVLYPRCESGASEMAEMDAVAGVVTDRGGAPNQAKDVCLCLTNEYPVENLSKAEQDALLYMREEEKLAHDVYTVLSNQWGAQVFSNIAGAEQRHTEAILCLLNKYKLTDPAGNNAAGVFQNTILQKLYNDLIAEGKQSKAAAFAVGAKIEDVDIADLLKAMPDMDNAEVRAVFGELTRGSRNHLRAFVTNLEAINMTYIPAFISQQLFDEITSSPQEKGGSICGTCLNANNPNCKANPNCTGPNGQKGCLGNGPNGNNNCIGTGPNGNKGCPGNGPKGNNGNGNGPKGNNGPGNGNNGGNGNGPKGNNGGGN